MTTRTDPDPDKRITNSDEQEVAVNQSTREEGGYDEPASTRNSESSVVNSEQEKSSPEKADDSTPEERDPERKESSTRRKPN